MIVLAPPGAHGYLSAIMLAELIPKAFFMGLDEWLLWSVAAGAIALLVYGADRGVSGAVRLAVALGMPKVIIGATIVSLGTTAPEAVVSVKAAWEGDPGLALGNGMGSIICNMGLIFGISCLIRRLPLDRFVLNRHGWIQLGCGVLLGATMLGLWAVSGDVDNILIGRPIGILFILLLVAYMVMSVYWSRRHPELIPREADVQADMAHRARQTARYLGLLMLGLALIVAGAELLVGSVRVICERHEVPKSVISATFVAFGTSLPELVTAIASIVKGHSEILVGNIVGANVLNVLFVIGASALARPLRVDKPSLFFLMPVMVLVLLLYGFYVLTNKRTFRRWQGIPLVVIYVAFIVFLVTFIGLGAS